MMRVTFLGHAGFCIETSRAIVVADPWMSPIGAFDSAWFQLPRNHHLAAYVQEKLADSRKERFLYISHEHKDHLDFAFLDSLQCRDFTIVIPDFRRTYVKTALAGYRCRRLIPSADSEPVPIPGGTLTLFLDDSELNRDSALLVKADGRSLFDMNDCRIVDALPLIARKHGPLDAFACQFSGAGWHPTCYAYPRDRYEAIARRKVLAKFAGVAQAIRTLQPRVYIPSAGPPCFLDPTLLHLNFEDINIFPQAPRLLEFLDARLKGSSTFWPELMPGDVLDVDTGEVVHEGSERVTADNYESYIRSYAASYESFFQERQRQYEARDGGRELLHDLRLALLEKLEALTLHDRVENPLYFRLSDVPDQMLRVDFPTRRIDYAASVTDAKYYAITAPSWEIRRILEGKITWDDFSLTFRMRLNREPDVYHTVVQGFLRLEPEDMNWFCARLLNIENNQERIVVEADGKRYAVDRYCPHQGGDLTRAWVEEGRFLTCARHQWQFDLEHDGQARRNEGSIHAVCLDDD